jgi:hypothetical protein
MIGFSKQLSEYKNNQSKQVKDGYVRVIIKQDEVQELYRKYKKLKKYMRSSLYTIKTLDGTETTIKNLLSENPPDD